MNGIHFYTLAPPRKVAMEINGVSSREYTFKVKEEGVRKLAVDCIARQSTPLPRFEWKLDGKPIEVIDGTDILVKRLNLLSSFQSMLV